MLFNNLSDDPPPSLTSASYKYFSVRVRSTPEYSISLKRSNLSKCRPNFAKCSSQPPKISGTKNRRNYISGTKNITIVVVQKTVVTTLVVQKTLLVQKVQ